MSSSFVPGLLSWGVSAVAALSGRAGTALGAGEGRSWGNVTDADAGGTGAGGSSETTGIGTAAGAPVVMGARAAEGGAGAGAWLNEATTDADDEVGEGAAVRRRTKNSAATAPARTSNVATHRP